MTDSSSRVAGQYGRKRVIQACLVCRARKSRCDSQRPRCGFCVRTESECTYPETETSKLDRASLLILERIQTMEDSVLQQLNVAALPQSSRHQPTGVDSRPQSRTSAAWPNGDVVMTWHALRPPAIRSGLHSHWGGYRDELCAVGATTAVTTPGLSPSIKSEFSHRDPSANMPLTVSSPFNNGHFDADLPMPMDLSSDVTNPLAPELAAPLIYNYIVHIHSKSPVLDLDFLRRLLDCLLAGGFVYDGSILTSLPDGFEEPDLAILMLVLALGQVSSELEPKNQPVRQNNYIKLALPWLGLTAFSGRSPIRDLQAQLLLASYNMWILKPWAAWCYADTAASKAEKLLLRYPEIVEDKLSHRVLWAVATMQLELAEEIYPHLDVVQCGRLAQLIQSTPIPPPPLQPFVWPGISSHLNSVSWYHYLADTCSRRLVERSRLSCMIPRINSLPACYRGNLQSTPDESPIAPDALAISTKQRMQKDLRNRQGQLLMLVFRPFLATLADGNYKSPNNEDQTTTMMHLLEGTSRYLHHAIDFLHQQQTPVERHYGCWLLARNIWSAALSLLVACHTPTVLHHMEEAERKKNHDANRETDSSAQLRNEGGVFYQKAVDAAEGACTMLRQWEHESRSLKFCADLLFSLVLDARRHKNRTKDASDSETR
ncbi:hypothetical protein AUP68_02171 [Ilyonectria robusta]